MSPKVWAFNAKPQSSIRTAPYNNVVFICSSFVVAKVDVLWGGTPVPQPTPPSASSDRDDCTRAGRGRPARLGGAAPRKTMGDRETEVACSRLRPHKNASGWLSRLEEHRTDVQSPDIRSSPTGKKV